MAKIDNRNPLAIERDRWFESPEGLSSRDIETLGRRDSSFLSNRLEGAFLAGARSQARLESDFTAKLSEILLGYREGRDNEILEAAQKLMALKLVCDTADELLESKKEIFAAATNLRDLLQDSEG